MLAMRQVRLRFAVICCVAIALVATTSHYLAHFHVPGGAKALPASVLGYVLPAEFYGHETADGEHCGLCLQLDRLPASPAPLTVPAVSFSFIQALRDVRAAQLTITRQVRIPAARAPPSTTV